MKVELYTPIAPYTNKRYLMFGEHTFAAECGQRVPRVWFNTRWGLGSGTIEDPEVYRLSGTFWLPVTEGMLKWYDTYLYKRLANLKYFMWSDFLWAMWERATPFLEQRRKAKWERVDSQLPS